jgi:hypothetical protein
VKPAGGTSGGCSVGADLLPTGEGGTERLSVSRTCMYQLHPSDNVASVHVADRPRYDSGRRRSGKIPLSFRKQRAWKTTATIPCEVIGDTNPGEGLVVRSLAPGFVESQPIAQRIERFAVGGIG